MADASAALERGGLARGAIGLREVLFQAVTSLHFGPVTTFALLATILTGIMIAIYIVFDLSCIMYYLRFA
jgi:hypothetical protein